VESKSNVLFGFKDPEKKKKKPRSITLAGSHYKSGRPKPPKKGPNDCLHHWVIPPHTPENSYRGADGNLWIEGTCKKCGKTKYHMCSFDGTWWEDK
jgi:hypothetical protein